MTAIKTMIAWALSAIMTWAPPGRPAANSYAVESEQETRDRYEQIATAIIEVAFSKENPPIFAGPMGRAQTASIIMSVAYYESAFRKDVDLGLGKAGRGDGGRSHCLAQIQLGKDRSNTSILEQRIGKKWSADDLVQDRVKCFQTAYVLIRQSFNGCWKLPVKQRLAAYTSGSCGSGFTASERRVNKAGRWFALHKSPMQDSQVMEDMDGHSSGWSANDPQRGLYIPGYGSGDLRKDAPER